MGSVGQPHGQTPGVSYSEVARNRLNEWERGKPGKQSGQQSSGKAEPFLDARAHWSGAWGQEGRFGRRCLRMPSILLRDTLADFPRWAAPTPGHSLGPAQTPIWVTWKQFSWTSLFPSIRPWPLLGWGSIRYSHSSIYPSIHSLINH